MIKKYQSIFFEIGIFILFFVLFTLSEWNVFNSTQTFTATASYFLALYFHARLQRFSAVKYLINKKNVWILLSILLLASFAFIVIIIKKSMYHYCNLVTDLSYQQTLFFSLASCIVSSLFINIPFIFERFYDQKKKAMAYQLLVKNTELNSLRANLNPHFIFNTFNNLYGTSLREPDKIPDMLLNVSELMRYQLEHLSNEKVFLKDEIRFIETYLSMEEERLEGRCTVDYNYQKKDKQKKFLIAPLILIPFVENAFKHGSNTLEKSFVSVWITETENGVNLIVENSIPQIKNQTNSTGLGLKTIQHRLDILYQEKYKMTFNSNEKIFKVELSINLIDG